MGGREDRGFWMCVDLCNAYWLLLCDGQIIEWETVIKFSLPGPATALSVLQMLH